MSGIIVQAELGALCSICQLTCGEQDEIGFDRVLFEECLAIMQDDLAAALEYLRLKSPLDQVICYVRNFVRYIVREEKKCSWYDRNAKKLIDIPPDAFTRHLKLALERWLYEQPEKQVLDEVENLLAIGLKERLKTDNHHTRENQRPSQKRGNSETRQAAEKQESTLKMATPPVQSFMPQQTADRSNFRSAIDLMRTLDTECPACGGELTVAFDENELEMLLTGGRVMRKAVEHVNGSDAHVVELVIDSQLRIRRSNVLKLARAAA